MSDLFRDPSVWWIKGDKWCKLDIDGEERTYGKVNLSNLAKHKYFTE